MNNHHRLPIRVLHILSGDLWAGAEAVALTLLCEMTRGSHINVHAALMNDGTLAAKLREADISVSIFDENRFSAIAIVAKLRHLANDFRPQIVHTHRQKENVLGSIVARAVHAKSIRTVHGWTEFPDPGLRLDKRLFRWLDTAAGRYLQQRVIAVSDDLKMMLSTQFDRECIIVVENGINLCAVREASKKIPDLPGIVTACRIGIVGRLVSVKRHDRFIAAASLLLDSHQDEIECYIVGDGPLANSVASLIRDSGHAENIHQLGFRQDIPGIVGTLDALVVTSDHEGVPMNVLEAASLGVPIVSVPIPSIAAIIQSGAKGMISDQSSAESLAEAIATTMNAGKSMINSLDDNWRYSSSTMASRYLEIYADLVTS